eukprot:349319-Pyramimonas_sp.AAC.1
MSSISRILQISAETSFSSPTAKGPTCLSSRVGVTSPCPTRLLPNWQLASRPTTTSERCFACWMAEWTQAASFLHVLRQWSAFMLDIGGK